MDQITVTIPDPTTKAFVDQILSAGQYPSASDYLLELIRQDRDRRRRARLEALVIEGLEEEGKSIILTDEVWETMLRDFQARHPEANQP